VRGTYAASAYGERYSMVHQSARLNSDAAQSVTINPLSVNQY